MDTYDFYAEKAVTWLPLVIVSVIAVILLLPNSRKKFLRLQASLPTSKISSVAMGLVEIQGTLIMKDALVSPVSKEECIGYHYTVEDITKDKDGSYSYHTIHRETRCNPFMMKDDSGTIDIQAEGIELILLKETHVRSDSQKRYTETLLKSGQQRLLVGYADAADGIAFIRKDTGSNILGITGVEGIGVWNKYQPLLRSFMLTWLMISAVIILILSQ